MISLLFFFNDTATTEIYTLSLHDALPIFNGGERTTHRRADWGGLGATDVELPQFKLIAEAREGAGADTADRKSTRLNSSHGYISYAVFCLKKKKKRRVTLQQRIRPTQYG